MTKTKLLGIVQIRGWDSMENHVLKGFSLIDIDGITVSGNVFMQDIRQNIGKRKLENEKLKMYQAMMEDLENRKIDTHSFRGVYKEYTNEDLRASFPTTERLESMPELKQRQIANTLR